MKSFLIILLLTFSFSTNGQNLDSIRSILLEINLENVDLRNAVMPTVKKYGFNSPEMDSLNEVIFKFDSSAYEKTIRIIDQYGWLGISPIGEEANSTIFLALQHARNVESREKYYPLLEESALKGESSLSDMATMKDRILIEKGKMQVYGTQYKMENNELVLCPIEDIENVNKRREQVGLKKIDF